MNLHSGLSIKLYVQISESQIFETYGGRSGIKIDEDRDGHAYMLMYRRIDPLMSSLPMTIEEMPTHIRVCSCFVITSSFAARIFDCYLLDTHLHYYFCFLGVMGEA